MFRLHPAPAPSRTPRFTTTSLATGVRLHCAEQGGHDGAAVILLHGYSDSWFSWSRIMPLLSAEWWVLAPDQRGHGRSTGAACYGMDDLAADVLALMDARGIARAVLVGHSMGSFVAQRVAEEAPGRVAGLGLAGSGCCPRCFTGMDALEAEVEALGDPVPLAFIRDFQYSTVHAPVPEAFMTTAIAESRRLDAATWRGLMAGMMACPESPSLAGLGIPTWLAWGDRDALAGAGTRERLARHVGAHARSAYADTGHALHWERPLAFAYDLDAFIARATGATTSRRSA